MDEAAVRRANAEKGVNTVVLQHGWKTAGPLNKECPKISFKIIEAFFAFHAGYRLRRFRHEMYGEQERQKQMNFGCRLESDYAAFFADGFPPPPSAHHPYLMGMRAEDLEQQPIHASHSLFSAPKPHFRFKPGEQDALRCALEGETVEMIAQSLFVSL